MTQTGFKPASQVGENPCKPPLSRETCVIMYVVNCSATAVIGHKQNNGGNSGSI